MNWPMPVYKNSYMSMTKKVEPAREEAPGKPTVGHLGDDEAGGEGEPRVRLGLLLARLENVAAADEERLQLGEHAGRDKDELENGKHLGLQVVEGVANHPKGEAVEEGGKDVQHDLVVDVLGVAPERDVHAVGDDANLLGHGRGKLVAVIDGAGGLGGGVGDDGVELGRHLVVLGRLEPDLAPVAAVDAVARDDVNHVLGRVGVGRAGAAVAAKVVLDGLAVLANVAKVDGLAAAREQQQAVKLRKELRRGLVDGDEHRLPDGGELAQKLDGAVGRLPVEARRGLVEEDEDAGLGHELDANGDALALLHGQAGADLADERVGEGLELEQVDDGVDVGELLLARRLAALAEKRRELERLADRRVRLVHVELLAVARGPLKGDGERAAVDEDGTGNGAVRLALGEHVEERRLAGARRSHERRQITGLDPALDIVEQETVSRGRLDSVREILPRKDGRVSDELVLKRVAAAFLLGARGGSVRGDGLLLGVEVLLVGVGVDGDVLAVLAGNHQARAVFRGRLPSARGPDCHADKERPPSPDDAKVAPEVGVAVGQRGEVVVAEDKGRPGLAAADAGTRTVRRVGVVGTAGDEIVSDAIDNLAVELVGEQGVKGVREGVDPEYPDQPGMHLGLSELETCVEKGGSDDDAGHLGSIVKRLEQGADSTEQCRHAEAGRHDNDPQNRNVGGNLGEAECSRVEKGKGLVLDQDRSSIKGIRHFRHGNQGRVEERKEERARLGEQTGRVTGRVVKEGAGDEGLDDVGDLLDDKGGLVAPDDLVLALDAGADLLREADRQRAARRNALVLLEGDRLFKVGGAVARLGRRRVVVLGGHARADGRGLVGFADGGGGARELVALGRLHLALRGNGDARQVVGDVGPGLADEAELLHKGPRLGHGSVKRLLALVEHEHLVKEVVDAVAGLVERDNGREAEDVGQGADGLCVVESTASMLVGEFLVLFPTRTSSGIVPAKDAAVGGQTLNNGHALALASRDAADKRIADFGIVCVLNAHGLEQKVPRLLLVLVAVLDALRQRKGHVEAGGKVHGLPDGQCGKEDFLLGVHDDLAAVALGLVGRHGAEAHVAGHVGEAAAVVGQHLEQRGAAGAGAAEDEQHLAGPHAAVHAVENGLHGRLLARLANLLQHVELRPDVLVDGGVGADRLDRQVRPGDAELAARQVGRAVALVGRHDLVLEMPIIAAAGGGGGGAVEGGRLGAPHGERGVVKKVSRLYSMVCGIC
ncbi:hypothetical protein BM221_003861 [Beauveria bassiana]|uniref:Uncharacterized protein n=1 Tax=Beauveria bassiana TaxID=176275 RepID=A0A2N6NPM7_BEABA|nr:hypothetical protein BM221_003861 [Beauveria bassiana]